MLLKPGTRWHSTTCETQVMVVRAPATDVDLRCGGAPVVAAADATARPAPAAGFDGGSLMGKRYVHDDLGLEVLCVKAGAGSLSVGDEVIFTKEAKALPSSD